MDNLENVGATGVTVENETNDSLISGTNGDDSIHNTATGTNSTILALGGDDTILNSSKYSVIDAGEGDDSINNYNSADIASDVSINAGAGNDTIRNQHAYNVTLDGGEGDDKIIVITGDHTNINGGVGNDTILGETLEGGSSTWAMGGYANIDGGDGDDYIDPIYSDSASITGGVGNDTIINEGNDATLSGGKGDDVISLHGASLESNVIKYETGDGNDSLFGFNETTKLSITSGTAYSTVENGDDVIVNVGENFITIAGGKNLSTINIINYDIPALDITNTANQTLINGSSLNDTINNYGLSVTIKSIAGDDSINSSGDNSSINAGAGSDSIINSGANSTLLGDYGNDNISNSGDNVLINGSYGNDTIENSGSNVTIDAGNGYNLTSNTGDNVSFRFGGGIDTIEGFSENSTLSIGGSAKFDTLDAEFKNVLVYAGNSVTILKDAHLNNDFININSTSYELSKEINMVAGGDSVGVSRSNVSILSGTGDDIISLSSGAQNDTIVYESGNGNDTIYGFNDTSKLSISDTPFSAETSGNDLIVTVGESKITLINAANLSANVATVYKPLTLDVMALRKTAAGYPVMAAVAFHPDEYLGDEPTNYFAKEDWTITSDDLKLHAVCYTPENSGDKWAVLIHGYGKDHKAMYTTATAYLDNGYNVLLIDQRAAGKSEGEWLTMGAAEAEDVALWTQEIVSRNENAKITLHGVSMGSATAMLAAARSDSKNVTALVEDCGYTNVMAVFDIINAAMLKQTPEVVAAMDPIAKSLTGYYLHDAAPIDSISSAKMPTLFITGSADAVAPVSMLNELYDESGAEVKEKFIIDGVEHGRAAFDDSVNYNNAVFRFIAEANEEGWNTSNANDGISLRGTKYDDTISSSGSNVTIDAGKGDDIISLNGGSALINYSSGDGNDTIYGFNESSKISIANEFSSVKVGDDVVFSVGENKITAVNASSVIATDFEDGETLLLTKKGAVTVDGKIFELTKNVPNGVTITGTTDGFTSAITDKEGKIFVEEFIAAGDDSYTVKIDSKGLQTISGIDAGTTVTTSATKDGKEDENQIYIVTEDAGSYTFNDMSFTTSNANSVIRLRPQAMAFDSVDGVTYDGKIFSGGGNVTVSGERFALGRNVSASGVNNDESFILAQKGTTTVDGKVFELGEDVPTGITVTPATDGYIFSHAFTEKELSVTSLSSNYVDKIFSERFRVLGDDTYSLQADSEGLSIVSGISGGSTILGGDSSVDGGYDSLLSGQTFYFETDSEGMFTVGEKTYTISGDSDVYVEAVFPNDGYAFAGSFVNLNGTVSGDFTGDELYVNGTDPILISGDDSIKVVGSSSGTKLFDVSDAATLASLGGVREIHTDTEGVFTFGTEKNDSIAVSIKGDDNVTFKLNAAQNITNIDDIEGDILFSETSNTLFINGMGGTFDGEFSSIGAYDNLLYVHDVANGSSFTTGQADKIWLQMVGKTMTLNGNKLTLTGDDDGIWLRDKEIVGLDEGASLQVSKSGTYLTKSAQLNAKSGDVIVGLENDDAYIYNENRPPITSATSNAELIKHFKPENYTVASGAENISLNGGDLAIVEDTAAQVSITAGDDTIISQGENVHVNLTGGNTQLFPLDGKMTLENYDASTGAGFNFAGTNISAWIQNGNIDFNNGILKIGSAQVDVGASDELINFYNINGRRKKVGWASQSDSLDVSNETADLVLVAKENSSITGGSGDDTIFAQGGNFIDGGEGSNFVSVSSEGEGSNIALNGRTTVEGFRTGFGSGTDTVYIKGDPAVDFKAGGLIFYEDNDSFTLRDVKETTKVNLYYANIDRLRKEIFIADDDWYTVDDSDLKVGSKEGVYFVGATAKINHGVDFSGVTQALNVTMNTYYDATDTSMWVNNIHSIKGGAGLTTIVGSDKSDTILAGTGESSIWGGAGHDKIFGNTSDDKNVTTFFYMAGDGRDSIENFDFTDNALDVTADKIRLDDNSRISDVFLRGDDVGIRIDGAKEFLILEDAKGKSFRLNDDLIAKVDTNVESDGFTNCYVGIGTKATLTVGKDLGDVEVWLSDDSLEYHGTMYDGSFAVLDASQADEANILAGNELNNSILGGKGDSSLWGGYTSSDDTLVGGAGHNTFYYLQGNGRDVIQNAHDGDEIVLDDITLDQIAEAKIYAGGVAINFTDGGSLSITGTANVTYQLANGSKYCANHTTQDWDSK